MLKDLPDGPISPDTPIDVGLLREAGEWEAVASCVNDGEPGGFVLVDGDLRTDGRLRSDYLSSILEAARSRSVIVIGVTKHTSLARGGAPLLAQLEREAEARFGPRALWWVPVAVTRDGEVQVVAARLDTDARFSFRVDLPRHADAAAVLGQLSGLSDDAGFPGYPYPLTVADRIAACPTWVRDEVRLQLDDAFDTLLVPLDVRERAFADRHRLMERA